MWGRGERGLFCRLGRGDEEVGLFQRSLDAAARYVEVGFVDLYAGEAAAAFDCGDASCPAAGERVENPLARFGAERDGPQHPA
jgi:hypothetical protein